MAMNPLERAMAELTIQRDEIVHKSGPLRARRDGLRAKILPLEAELRALNEEIAAIERPHLFDVDMQMGALAKAMGGRAMSDAP